MGPRELGEGRVARQIRGARLCLRLHEKPADAGTEPMSYSAFGAAVSEVELDVLTGEKLVLRSDIHFDCGQSLNPAVDMGQVRNERQDILILWVRT